MCDGDFCTACTALRSFRDATKRSTGGRKATPIRSIWMRSASRRSTPRSAISKGRMPASCPAIQRGKTPVMCGYFQTLRATTSRRQFTPVKRLVLALTDEGDCVFDPYMGVGSSVIAALLHGRVGYGCDIEQAYVDVAWQRVQALATRMLRTRPMGKPVYDPTSPQA